MHLYRAAFKLGAVPVVYFQNSCQFQTPPGPLGSHFISKESKHIGLPCGENIGLKSAVQTEAIILLLTLAPFILLSVLSKKSMFSIQFFPIVNVYLMASNEGQQKRTITTLYIFWILWCVRNCNRVLFWAGVARLLVGPRRVKVQRKGEARKGVRNAADVCGVWDHWMEKPPIPLLYFPVDVCTDRRSAKRTGSEDLFGFPRPVDVKRSDQILGTRQPLKSIKLNLSCRRMAEVLVSRGPFSVWITEWDTIWWLFTTSLDACQLYQST